MGGPDRRVTVEREGRVRTRVRKRSCALVGPYDDADFAERGKEPSRAAHSARAIVQQQRKPRW